MDGEAWGLSLKEFRQLSPHDQVLLLVPEGKLDWDTAASTAQRVAKLISASLVLGLSCRGGNGWEGLGSESKGLQAALTP